MQQTSKLVDSKVFGSKQAKINKNKCRGIFLQQIFTHIIKPILVLQLSRLTLSYFLNSLYIFFIVFSLWVTVLN